MFIQNKYTKWYYSIVEDAKSQNRKKSNDAYYEKHHIIPKSLGGTEVVLLTGKEHFICHLLLCKMTSGQNKYKMINALIRMAFSKSKEQKRYTSKSYSLVRKFIAQKNRETMKGVPKSDTARQNMKGRSGVYIRSETNIKNLTKANRINGLKRKGTKNPKASEKIKLRNKRKCQVFCEANNHSFWIDKNELNNYLSIGYRKGSKAIYNSVGRKWYTDGKNDKMFYPDKIEAGFYLGRTKNRKGL